MRRKQIALFIYLLGLLNAACMTELDTSLAYGNNGICNNANSHGFTVWHTLLPVYTRTHATHPISHGKK